MLTCVEIRVMVFWISPKTEDWSSGKTAGFHTDHTSITGMHAPVSAHTCTQLLHLLALHRPLKIDPEIKPLGCSRQICFCSNKFNYRMNTNQCSKTINHFAKYFTHAKVFLELFHPRNITINRESQERNIEEIGLTPQKWPFMFSTGYTAQTEVSYINLILDSHDLMMPKGQTFWMLYVRRSWLTVGSSDC